VIGALRRHRRPYLAACPMCWCAMIPTAADGCEYAWDLGASLSGRLTGLRYRHHLVDMGLGTAPIGDSRRSRELSLSLRGVQDSFHMRRRAPLDVLRDACTVLAAVGTYFWPPATKATAATSRPWPSPRRRRCDSCSACPDTHALAALVPLGKPTRQLTKLRRQTVEETVTHEHFDGAPFTRPTHHR
jgi:hypothetical protein